MFRQNDPRYVDVEKKRTSTNGGGNETRQENRVDGKIYCVGQLSKV